MPYDERDEESGQFTSSFANEEFIDAVMDIDGGGTSDVADAVGCKYRTAKARLDVLADEGRIRHQDIGNSILWLPANDAPTDGGAGA